MPSTPTTISAPDATNNDLVDISADSEGNLILEWEVDALNSNGNITSRQVYVEKISPNGSVLVTPVPLFSQGGAYFDFSHYDVSLAVDESDIVYAAYLEGATSTTPANMLVVNALDDDLVSVQPATAFTLPAGRNFLHADMASTQGGGYVVADIEEIRGGTNNTIVSTQTILRTFNADGSATGQSVLVYTDPGVVPSGGTQPAFDEFHRDVSVAVDAEGNEIVAFLQGTSQLGVNQLVIQVFSSDLAPIRAPITITGSNHFSSVDISVDSDGNYVVAYGEEIRGTNGITSRNVSVQKVDASGNMLGSPEVLFDESGQYFILGYRGEGVATVKDGDTYVALLSADTSVSPSKSTEIYNLTPSIFSPDADTVDFTALSQEQIDNVNAGANLYHGKGGNDEVTLPDKDSYELTPSVSWDDTETFYTGSQGLDTYTINAGDGDEKITGGDGEDTIVLKEGTRNGTITLTSFGDLQDPSTAVYTITYDTATITQTLTLEGVDKLVLGGQIDNPVTLTDNNVIMEALRLADEVYGSQNPFHVAEPLATSGNAAKQAAESVADYAIGRGWHPVSALELGMKPADYSEGNIAYSFVNGFYQAQKAGLLASNSEANALVLSGVVNGVQTLSITFRGTDQSADFLDYGNFQSHFDKYAPLISAIVDYLKTNTIGQVLIAGHSLGAGMVEYLDARFEAEGINSSLIKAVTDGSPGSEASADSSTLVNFINTNDLVPKLGDITTLSTAEKTLLFGLGLTAIFDSKPREGSVVYIDSDVANINNFDEHASNLYFDNVKKLLTFADHGEDDPFAKTALAHALAAGQVYNGPSLTIAVGSPVGFDPAQPRANYNGRYQSTFNTTIKGYGRDNFILGNDGRDDSISLSVFDLISSTGDRVIEGGTGTDRLVLPFFSNFYSQTADSRRGVTDLNFLSATIAGTSYSAGFVGALYGIEVLVFRDFLRFLDGHSPTIDVPVATHARTLGANLSGVLPTFTLHAGYDYADAGNGDMNIVGTSNGDVIYLGTGAKNVTGGAGDDIIIVKANNPGDKVVLNGGIGADIMVGGQGNETYYVDNAGDQIFVDTTAGQHTVMASVDFVLPQNVQALVLSGGAVNGTGNNLANTITGNAASNLLDGGADADRMAGGAGNDTYVVDDANDKVVEANNQGTDTIETSVAYALTGLYVENLTLTGTGNFNAGGNGFANVINGNSGNNSLNGGLNGDSMAGGAGNDLYFVDNLGDVVIENANEGKDAINASITYVLGDNVETLVLIGYQAIDGIGNALDNTVTGNGNANILNGGDGKDILIGQGGNDTLTGGNGADQFRFYAAGSANGLDHLTDFVSGTDKLAFTAADYGFAKGHVLTSAELHVGGAVGSNGQFLYNIVNHILYWDADGAGGNAAAAVMQFDNAAKPAAGDFVFV